MAPGLSFCPADHMNSVGHLEPRGGEPEFWSYKGIEYHLPQAGYLVALPEDLLEHLHVLQRRALLVLADQAENRHILEFEEFIQSTNVC